MRIGVSGVGRIGQMHATNIVATDGVTEVVLHDPAPGRAAAVAAELAAGSAASRGVTVRAVESLDDLLAGVDGVLVATPTPTHAAVVHAALDAGVPVLCEKPLAGDVAEVREVAAHAARVGVPLLVGFQRRFDPAIAELKRRIVTGETGDVYAVRATAFDHEPPPADYIPTSGGIFRDMFVHDLDCVPWLVGRRVTSVFATGSVLVDQAFADAGDVDTASITLVFEGGVIAQLVGGRKDGTGYDNRIDVFAEKAALASGYDARTPFVSLEPGGHDPSGAAYTGFQERYAPAYRREIVVFLDVIAGRAENPSPAADGLVSLVLAEACEQSLRSGAAVSIDPAAFAVEPTGRRAAAGLAAGLAAGSADEPADVDAGAVLGGRVAGAPISWGVCEVPGWGHVLPVDLVLGQMADLGLRSTELGPPGFLPDDPEALRGVLGAAGLGLVGGFLAVPLHDAAAEEATLAEAGRAAAQMAAAGGEVLVLAAATGLDGYDERPRLTDDEWARLVANAGKVRDIAASHGLRTTLHPHVGTHVEQRAEVERFVADSDVPLCLDTGHLLIGGTDPLELVRTHADKITHVHLKDVDLTVAKRVQAGEITYMEGVQQNMYVPLGTGDVPVAEIVRVLEAAGYSGWYVLEQDTSLPGADPDQVAKVVGDVARSVAHLAEAGAPVTV
ncbi:TIM barrel protein [Kineosporia sp. R_H_3]|uniref:TIM barrel protein n=1 Tax=Kineosporia sp. R_H_3 TaxID=1961848 RepID=UPI00117B2578|nr:TIM barrel protein [Kineosporia sp. R_H_3]